MYSYLKDLKKAQIDSATVKIEFRQRDIRGERAARGLMLTRIAAKGTTLFNAITGHGYHNKYHCAPVIFRQKASHVNYITLLEPLNPRAKAKYKISEHDGKITVSCQKRKWKVFEQDKKIKVSEKND